MAVTSTLTGNLFFTKPTRVLVTPFKDDGSAKDTTTYSLDSIVADSTSITQDEADRNEIECETRDSNIYEAVTLGKYQFTCDNADWQEALVTNILGFEKSGDTLIAPSSYKERFAEIEIQFGDASTYTSSTQKGSFDCSVVLPKVLLASSATIESLKTNVGIMTIAGTAYDGPVNGALGKYAPFYISMVPVTKPGGE